MSFLIRKAKLNDTEVIVSLWNSFMDEHDDIVIKENPRLKSFIVKEKNKDRIYKNFVLSNIKSSKGNIFLAEAKGEIIGYILVFIKEEIPIFRLKRYGYVSDLYVKEEYRNSRISSELIREAKDWFKAKNMREMVIAVYPANKKAYFIYKKWGFIPFHLEMRKKI